MAHEHLDDVKHYLLDLQERLCAGLTEADGAARFQEDSWEREEGGGGRSRVMTNGGYLKRWRQLFPRLWRPTTAFGHRRAPRAGWAQLPRGGCFLVLHPENPHVPTSHGNVRFYC